jgi:hypothetical protein
MSYNQTVKHLVWDTKKDEKLQNERHVCFEDVFNAFVYEGTLDVIKNPSRNFPNQMAFVVRIRTYIYYVPFVEDKETIYLKTIIPSRKVAKQYL